MEGKVPVEWEGLKMQEAGRTRARGKGFGFSSGTWGCVHLEWRDGGYPCSYD